MYTTWVSGSLLITQQNRGQVQIQSAVIYSPFLIDCGIAFKNAFKMIAFRRTSLIHLKRTKLCVNILHKHMRALWQDQYWRHSDSSWNFEDQSRSYSVHEMARFSQIMIVIMALTIRRVATNATKSKCDSFSSQKYKELTSTETAKQTCLFSLIMFMVIKVTASDGANDY